MKKNEPLRGHTTIKIGGPAKYFCIADTLDDLKEALRFAETDNLKVEIFGAGSNLLVSDAGFDGLIIKLNFNYIEVDNETVKVGAGVMLGRLVSFLADKGLGGLEFLAGIPGTVGGAIAMNAGAWGDEIGNYVEQATLISKISREIVRDKIKFSYRSSDVYKKEFIIVDVLLKVKNCDKEEINRKIKEYSSKRKASQPLGLPNCGSMFKNPQGDYAGRLIEAAGLKGRRDGDAQISEAHANFIVNLGGAKSENVVKLIKLCEAEVFKKFNIKLEPEIKFIGGNINV